MVKGSHLSIFTLIVNRLNVPTQRKRLASWMQKQTSYICCLHKTHVKPSDTYRLKMRGWGRKKKSSKCRPKENRTSNVHINKINFEIKNMIPHNDQGINPRERYNNYKYICTQHRSTSIPKANTHKYERGN